MLSSDIGIRSEDSDIGLLVLHYKPTEALALQRSVRWLVVFAYFGRSSLSRGFFDLQGCDAGLAFVLLDIASYSKGTLSN